MKIEVKKRTNEKRAVLSRGNAIPAVVYGPGIKNEKISIDRKAFKDIFAKAGETTLVEVSSGGKSLHVLIYDIQRDPVSLEPIHVDLYAPRLDVAIKARVPLVFHGESPAVKSLGGVLIKSMQEIEVEALPADLPHELSADLARLENLGDTLYIRDIRLPKNVKFVVDENTPVASVTEPRKEEVVEAAPAAEAVVPPPTEREVKAAEKAKTAEEEKAAQ